MSALAPAKLALPERYEVLRHVADGGMASVWCARDALLDRRVAIKLLDERFQRDPSAIDRFQREARTAARLSGHRNVVTIFDVGEAGGRAFIVMELLPCGTVAQALARGSVSRSEAVRWLREAASALDHAHRCGVVHRDVKPGNFLLDLDHVLHIGDFGIARAATDDTITSHGQLFGTAAYVAPEQVSGGPATPASDRYALAVTAFELLTGQRPFTAEHFTAQAHQHLTAPPPAASSREPTLPSAVDGVLARGMAKAPGERWATAGEMAAAIEQAVSTRPGRRTYRGRPAALIAPARARGRVVRGRRAPALAALGAGAIAAVLIAIGAGQRARPAPRSAEVPNHGTASVASRQKRPPRAAVPNPRLATPQTSPSQLAQTTGNPASLEARGHQLMVDGSYGQAISVLRQAVASAPPTSLTFAYALYDLGRSLRLSGDPRAAIPILERRLEIPNQSGAVSQELAVAERQAGVPTGGPGGAAGSGGAAPQALKYRSPGGKHQRHARHHGGG